MRIIGICGSLRKGSFNRIVLKEVGNMMVGKADFEIAEIGDLPFFNEDLEDNPPESVTKFRDKIKSADFLIIATPEYNYSVPSVLKNAIEWGSRPYGQAVLTGKNVAILGASTGMIGTARAQHHLRQIFVQVDMHPLNRPEVMIPFVSKKISSDGKLSDEHTREKLTDLVKTIFEIS